MTLPGNRLSATLDEKFTKGIELKFELDKSTSHNVVNSKPSKNGIAQKLSKAVGKIRVRKTLPPYTKQQILKKKKYNPSFREKNIKYRYIPVETYKPGTRKRMQSIGALRACEKLSYKQACSFKRKNSMVQNGYCVYQYIKPYRLYCK